MMKEFEMKKQTLNVNHVVIDELKDEYLNYRKKFLNKCSQKNIPKTLIELDYELLKAFRYALEYYMTAEELELWNDYLIG
tara:strand:+ start:566 stop:805 length:240 start_codon:yes stop_codon:yes gene_type:complete